MPIKAHPNQVDNIGVVELGHYGCLHQEVSLRLSGGHLREGFDCDGHFDGVSVTVAIETLVDLTKCTLAQCPVEKRKKFNRRIRIVMEGAICLILLARKKDE